MKLRFLPTCKSSLLCAGQSPNQLMPIDLCVYAFIHVETNDVGKVLQNRGVPFTHALVSRFPSVDALQTYYDYAILDIATKMMPWREVMKSSIHVVGR